MSKKVTAKVIAKGTYEGKPVTIEVHRHGGGEDKNGDWQKGTLSVLVNDVKFKNAMPSGCICDNKREEKIYFWKLFKCIVERDLANGRGIGYSFPIHPNTIEAYWLAFNYGDGFDEVPEITVEGKINTLGLPFSDEDTSHIVF